MIETMKTIKREIESLGYSIDYVLPDFDKQQQNETVYMLSYEVLDKQTDFCNRTTYTSKVNVIAVSKQRDGSDDWYIENHESLERIGSHLVGLTKTGRVDTINAITSFKFNELGVDGAMRYVNEIQLNVICQ